MNIQQVFFLICGVVLIIFSVIMMVINNDQRSKTATIVLSSQETMPFIKEKEENPLFIKMKRVANCVFVIGLLAIAASFFL